MNWILLSFLTALCRSLTDIFTKKSGENYDFLKVAWATNFFALPPLFFLVLKEGVPQLNSNFFIILVLSGLLNSLVSIFYAGALKQSDISQSIPMVAFSPLLLLLTSPLILNEFPNIAGASGIVLIVIGSYIANLKKGMKIFDPFKSLFTNTGTRLMLGVAFIWSITANLDKIGLNNSTPVFWGFSVYLFMAVFLFRPRFLKLNRQNKYRKHLISAGLFNGMTIVFQMQALTLTIVPYVIAIKRTSVLMSVIAGFIIFKETSILKRTTGALLMFAGVVLIILFNK
ncbi:MAG: EamA family transporter [Candidatus Muiribacteriota bacterium]